MSFIRHQSDPDQRVGGSCHHSRLYAMPGNGPVADHSISFPSLVRIMVVAKELELPPLSLTNNSLPSTIEFLSKAQTFSIRIPAKLLGIYIDNPRLLCNQIPSGGTLYRGVLKELFFCLWRQCEDGATEESQKAVINTFLSFLAISFETGNKRQLSHAHKSEFLLSRIKEYIDNNLSNIHLSPELVAQEFHISTRYLRKLFQAEGTNSMTDYIRYKRLDKCADDYKSCCFKSILHTNWYHL